MATIGFTSNPSVLLLELAEESVIAKRIVLPRVSPYFQILKKEFDFGWEDNILVICDPTTVSNKEFELLFPSMLPHKTNGEFFVLCSIVYKQGDVFIAGELTFKDYANARKHLRIRKGNKYLPIIWNGETNETDKIEEKSSN